MDILAIKESFETVLLWACLMSLAGLFMIWVSLKIRLFERTICQMAKRYGWSGVLLFFICSAWATYTAFPTSEEKQEYLRAQQEKDAINNAWGSVFAPSHFPQNGLNAPTLEDVNKADTNVANESNEASSAQPGSESDNPRDEIEDLANKRTLTTDDFRRGFVLTSIGTNEVHDFSPSENAIIDSDWRTFGAAEDWSYLSFNDWAFLLGTNEIERLRVCSYGEVDPVASFTNTYFAPFLTSLGIVPASNWHLLDEADRPCQFWHEMTSLNTLKLTWQNVLYNRSTNTPVCFQMELWPNGNFAYRYNLSKAGLWNGEAISNIFVGAVCEGLEKSVDISSLTNLTSLAFYRLDPDDMPGTDRDEDGLSIEDELFIYHTDPNCWDSDFDGISDGDEVVLGTNPALRDSDGDGLVDGSDPDPGTQTSLADADEDAIPDSYEEYWFGSTNFINSLTMRDETGFDLNGKILGGINPTNAPFNAVVASTNALISWKLFNAFAADWSAEATNIVWERTFPLNRTSAWQQFFLSSSSTNATSWSLHGMNLEWETDDGMSGIVKASPFNDSYRIPLSTNDFPSAITLRLRSTGTSMVHTPTPLHLIAYAPQFVIEGGEQIIGESGLRFSIFKDGSDSTISLKIDHSLRPCKAPIGVDECDMKMFFDMSEDNGDFIFSGDSTGGTITARRPGSYEFPTFSIGFNTSSTFRRTRNGGSSNVLVVLDPSASWGCNGHGCEYDGLGYDWWGDSYYEEEYYPLDSKCLRKSWYRDWGAGGGGYYDGDCEVTVTAGTDSGYVTTDVIDNTGYVYVDGVEVWSDSPEHVYDDTGCGGGGYSENYLGDNCDSCANGCENGNCDSQEGPSLGSLKFRIPLGNPVKGHIAGFAWFSSNYPIRISRSTFAVMAHPSANISDTTSSGVRRIVSTDRRGRDLRLQNISNGVRVTIYETDTGKLEHTWEITNIDGDSARVRLRKISRLNNLMTDETYTYCDGDWVCFDNIAGIGTELYVEDALSEYGDGAKRETRITKDAAGNVLKAVTTENARIGECDNAVMREVYREESTGRDAIYTYAEYWNDPAHSSRHGQPRLVWGNARAWVYTDFDEKGHETLRVEQRGDASFPGNFPYVDSNVLYGAGSIENAFVTVKDYAPFAGDSRHADDAAKARQETRYLVVNGNVKTIGRTWKRYTRLNCNGYSAIKEETWRAFSPSATRDAESNAYSYEITFAVTGEATPHLMRGAVAESLDENGILTVNTYSLDGEILKTVSRKSFNGVLYQTYSVTDQDATYGNQLRKAEYLTANDTLIGNEVSTYDEKNRLRSTVYFDGTFITNAYSCCRLLWRQDREGRKTLRSAKTGEDHLYFAEEDVWLSQVSTNGQYRVTQHFFDAIGRETNTVVYVGSTPSEAIEKSASNGKVYSSAKTEYPYGGSDYAVSTDERGKVTISREDIVDGGIETGESVFTNGIDVIRTKSRTYFGGGSSMRREWGGDKWTEERRFAEYADDGKRIEYVVTESYDCGIVTNSVSLYDFLGRVVEEQDTIGYTCYTYDGSSSRMLDQTRVCGNIVRFAQFIYNSHGDKVGVLQDGITSRSDIAYDVDSSNIAWRVTTERVFGEGTNSCIVTRERLTGLSDECRSQNTRSDLSGAWKRITKSFDSALGLETETTESSSSSSTTLLKKKGLTVETSASSGRVFNEYDALGRISFVSRTIGNSEAKPYQAFEYAPSGDIASLHTFTNGTDVISESYLHDMLGNRIATTDAIRYTIYKLYDPLGNVLAEWGATYPVRYTYDTQNRRTSLSTTRDGTTWDTTTWSYDAVKGHCLSKTYADGSQVLYTYTPDNLPLRTTYPSGRWTENVYNAKREVVSQITSDGDNSSSTKDEFGRTLLEVNSAASVLYSYADTGIATNEVWLVNGEERTIVRTLDSVGRLSFNNDMFFTYTDDGNIQTLSNDLAKVEYHYTDDRLESGYSITLSNGRIFTRATIHDDYRRELLTSISSLANGANIDGFTYTYDALNRPIIRSSDTFAYNERSEVVDAFISGNAAQYGYDEIGNSTNWLANNLNQYSQFQHDLDGNLLDDGNLTFTYDSANRLKTVSSNGVVLVTNFYDAKSRRVKKVTPNATTTFFYDDWNLIEERIAYTDGTSSVIKYYWGKDLSGTLQGAGGIRGLLYETIHGVVYIPCYDNNGNVTKYVDANGNIVASYTYNAFGKLISKSGPLADFFRHRFSTKYFDPETGLYYYGYRFYHPVLMRWLNRDPIEEDGGLNLYGFCGNNGVTFVDYKGNDIYLYTGNDSGNIINDAIHQTVAVDIWSNECPPRKIGMRGFSFGYINEWDWNWPNGKWLGHSSITLPGFWMVGMIYESSVVGKAVNRKKTTPEQDRKWLKKMEGRVGTKDVYSVGRHNCRAFSQAEFNNAP